MEQSQVGLSHYVEHKLIQLKKLETKKEDLSNYMIEFKHIVWFLEYYERVTSHPGNP